MNNLKYIFYIIFGIILYFLFHNKNRFSIGNQYKLDRELNSSDLENLLETDPNNILFKLYKLTLEENSVCSLTNFEECQRVMDDEHGGSCQINTITGLYHALNVPFSEKDHLYIDSQDIHLADKINLTTTYDYLTNRPIMKPLLVYNGIDPTSSIPPPKEFSKFKVGYLYSLYIGFVDMKDGLEVFKNEDGTSFSFGHGLLMYKTDMNGVNDFLKNPKIQSETTLKINLLRSYMDALAQDGLLIESQLPGRDIYKSRIVLIFDLCNSLFYTVDELDYPHTIELIDDDGNISDIDTYNTNWNIKLTLRFKYFLSQQFNTKNIITAPSLGLENLDLNTLESTTFNPEDPNLINWFSTDEFIQRFIIYSNSAQHANREYALVFEDDAADIPLKSNDVFYGKENTLCYSDGTCDDDLVCVLNEKNHNTCYGGNIFYKFEYFLYKIPSLEDEDTSTVFSRYLYKYKYPLDHGSMDKIIGTSRWNNDEIFYLGYFKKRKGMISSMRSWDHRHFFVIYYHDLNKFYLIYGVFILGKEDIEKYIRTHRRLDGNGPELDWFDLPNIVNDGIARTLELQQSIIQPQLVFDQRGKYLMHETMFKKGDIDDYNPDNCTTIFFHQEDNLLKAITRSFIELHSDLPDTTNNTTSISQLNNILEYLMNEQEIIDKERHG